MPQSTQKLLLAAEGFQDEIDGYDGPCLYQGDEALAYYRGRDAAKAKEQ
jgi:hypothetical protein